MVEARLEALLARVRRVRKNLYPEGWDADPLYDLPPGKPTLLRVG